MPKSSRAVYGVLLGLAIATAGLGLAIAQDTGGDAGDEGDADVAIRRRANLTGPEQIAEGERIQARGMQISRRVAQLLAEARRERDVIRITCLNDKLTQINANLRTVEQRLEDLREAVGVNDESRRNHEFTVLTVLATKFNTLEQEANQCIGQDIFETGPTEVTTIIDDDVPEEEVTPGAPPSETVPPFPPVFSPIR